jgi:hypothetical protein
LERLSHEDGSSQAWTSVPLRNGSIGGGGALSVDPKTVEPKRVEPKRPPMQLTLHVGLYLRPTPSLFLLPVPLSSVRSVPRSAAGAPAPSSRWGQCTIGCRLLSRSGGRLCVDSLRSRRFRYSAYRCLQRILSRSERRTVGILHCTWSLSRPCRPSNFWRHGIILPGPLTTTSVSSVLKSLDNHSRMWSLTSPS